MNVIEMAREAGLIAQEGYQGTGWFWVENNLEHFAELVRADEREACAKVCDDLYRVWVSTDNDDINPPDALDCKIAIRARSNT